ncbi:Reverse transcriptase domain-containing protein [Aphis craccivora]|uniref:Reverse transcriptase domain-containing protein n=1 Tax=Aphis craccivora TaxID=307492 RepID=A0A6G0Y202_APHCR|nr:Reverse transcriptase domain-containing protein [Aphis craccivora]
MCLVLNCYRNTSSCCFINELIEGNTDVPRLLERLNIRVTSNTKFKGLFYQPVNHTNFANNSSLIRMILIANSNLFTIDYKLNTSEVEIEQFVVYNIMFPINHER